jgi:uncharacterized protein
MNKIVSDNIKELEKLCIEYSVKSMFVFGSICNEKFSNTSDIDFLVSFDNLGFEKYADNYFDLHDKLQQLFGRKIDLLTENSLSNPYFIKSVNQTKQLVYAA